MADHRVCPGCGRKSQKSMFSNHFPVYRCAECGSEYCKQCRSGRCPRCGADKGQPVGKVFSRS